MTGPGRRHSVRTPAGGSDGFRAPGFRSDQQAGGQQPVQQPQRAQAPQKLPPPGGRGRAAPLAKPAESLAEVSRFPIQQQQQQQQALPRIQGNVGKSADGTNDDVMATPGAFPVEVSTRSRDRRQDPIIGAAASDPLARQAEQGQAEGSRASPVPWGEAAHPSTSAPGGPQATWDSSSAGGHSPAPRGSVGSPAMAATPQSGTPGAHPGGMDHSAAAREPADAAGGSRAPLRDVLLDRNIVLRSYAAGQHNGLMCPQCQGGSTKEASFSINIEKDGSTAAWKCHRGTCGFEGGVSASTPPSSRSARTRGGEHPTP